jgi:hypothetical protein
LEGLSPSALPSVVPVVSLFLLEGLSPPVVPVFLYCAYHLQFDYQ